ncbi:hypothetical protein NDU88_011724 [Pleurodeles waltl]|uniref:Uncharacterized protein n=1 Tax=Pleurodeles waltl TaxID=8319 RepID=A0AAV7QY27_PLEWA|nr:hypothetical protein NDU88_011724 [Pleurodeles waltl]
MGAPLVPLNEDTCVECRSRDSRDLLSLSLHLTSTSWTRDPCAQFNYRVRAVVVRVKRPFARNFKLSYLHKSHKVSWVEIRMI